MHFDVHPYLEHSSATRRRTKKVNHLYDKSIRISGYYQFGGAFFCSYFYLFFLPKAPKEEWTDGQLRVATGWHHQPRRKRRRRRRHRRQRSRNTGLPTDTQTKLPEPQSMPVNLHGCPLEARSRRTTRHFEMPDLIDGVPGKVVR